MTKDYPPDWQTRRKKVYRRDDYTCQNCGVTGGAKGDAELHAHHIVPKKMGGEHQLSNLVTLCKDCHNASHEKGQARTANENEKKKTETFYKPLPENWESLRTRAYERDNYTCQHCGSKGGPQGNSRVIVHHNTSVDKLSSIGSSDLNTICYECHDQYFQPLSEPTDGGKGVEGLIQQLDLSNSLDIMKSHLEIMLEINDLSEKSQLFVKNSIKSLRSCVSNAGDLTKEWPELTEETKYEYKNNKRLFDKTLKNGYMILLELEKLAIYASFENSYKNYYIYAKNFRDLYFAFEEARNGLETGITIDENGVVHIDEFGLVEKFIINKEIFHDTGDSIADSIKKLQQVAPDLQRSLENDKEKILTKVDEIS